MKKIFVVLLIICVLCFIGCGERADDRVSYRQTCYSVGREDCFSVTLISGLRESPYIADGERGEMLEFCIVTLKPEDSTYNDTYGYKIELKDETLTGTLKKDAFGTTLSCDLGRDIGELITAITIVKEDGEVVIGLENMMGNAVISGDDALEIAKAQFSEKIAQEESEGVYREIYVKFVSDTTGKESTYYWYVALVGNGGDYCAVLIDIVSGDIIAKRK